MLFERGRRCPRQDGTTLASKRGSYAYEGVRHWLTPWCQTPAYYVVSDILKLRFLTETQGLGGGGRPALAGNRRQGGAPQGGP
ncbi:MAG: hypothetical protein LBK25_04145 [Treponema sp.]|nr:hypothetical protein [Treponema sp.]